MRTRVSRDPIKVILSCQTPEQLNVATVFVHLWLKRCGLPVRGDTGRAFHGLIAGQSVLLYLGPTPGVQHGKNVVAIHPKAKAQGQDQQPSRE